MIPIRDINPTHRTPVVTWAIIAINLGLFFYLSQHGSAAEELIWRFGLVPQVLSELPLGSFRSEGGSLGGLVTPVTSMFLHGSWLHVLSNMWFLHVFGDNIEDALGRPRYVAFYLLTGLAAAASQLLIDPLSDIPMVGASGAISGVLGAYVLLYPSARVVTFLPPFFFVEVPAFLFLLFWFVMQFVGFATMVNADDAGGVAWAAHLGGFVAGALLVRLLRPKCDSHPWEERAYP